MPEALKYARPGDQGSPTGSSEFTGEDHPNDGPYAMRGGKYFSVGVVRDLARTLGLLVSDEGQRIFERLVTELSEIKLTHDATLAQMSEVEQERIARNDLIADLHAEIAALQSERDRQTTLTSIATEFIEGAKAAAKAPKAETKTRRLGR